MISEELYEFLTEFDGPAFSEMLHGIRNPYFLEAAREDLLAISMTPPHDYELTPKAHEAIKFYKFYWLVGFWSMG